MSGTPAAPNGKPAPGSASIGARILLLATTAVLIGWFVWLSYTALTKSRAPIVSRAQATAATVVVVAELDTATQDRVLHLRRPAPNQDQIVAELKEKVDRPAIIVKVVEQLTTKGPGEGEFIGVENLPSCTGYTGPGKYLLLMNKNETGRFLDGDVYILVGQQRSPGADLSGVGPPMVYRWEPDVEAQAKRLFPK
jgi:hypothetical protein